MNPITFLNTNKTLVDLLRWRALHQPDQRAYAFLRDGEVEIAHLTYAQLDEKARAIAAWLQEMDAEGERALLLYPSGLDFIAAFFACLYAGVTAVPAYPPGYDRSNRRLSAIVKDAEPAVILTDSRLHSLPELAEVESLVTENISTSLASEWEEPSLSAERLAFLQYTSGSTAHPKGVMITHDNLLHNLAAIYTSFDATSNDRGLAWLPLYHDMGLIGGVLLPLYSGGMNTLMSPLAFLQNPLRWLQAISRYQVTISGGPNFAYDLCLTQIAHHQREGLDLDLDLDLSCWQIAFNGAEPIRADTIERFVTAFEPYGFRREAFYPCYGLAESTLLVYGSFKRSVPRICHLDEQALRNNQALIAEDGRAIVGHTEPVVGQDIAIVNPQSQMLCSEGQVGEIWVAGASVAKGYWRRHEETKETFDAYLAESNKGPFLRTGDLGFLMNNELFVTGRLKDLMIIRGRNHYPQDIELTVEESHPALRPNCGAAFSIDVAEQEQVVIVFELKRDHQQANVDKVATAVRAAVSKEHDLEVHAVALIRTGHLPKTTSGKIQRQACRKAYLANKLPLIGISMQENRLDYHSLHATSAPTSALPTRKPIEKSKIESELRATLAEMLSVSPHEVDFTQPIHSLGLGSLVAAMLLKYVEENFETELPIETFASDINLDQLITQLLTETENRERGTVNTVSGKHGFG